MTKHRLISSEVDDLAVINSKLIMSKKCNDKYEFTDECKVVNGVKLRRIRAIRDFKDIRAGELGGFIETMVNLSHSGTAWVYNKACVYGYGRVAEDAAIYDDVLVYGTADVKGDAKVFDTTEIYDRAVVSSGINIIGKSKIYGSTYLQGNLPTLMNANLSRTTDILYIGPIGSREDVTLFYKTIDNVIFVRCGCFRSNIDNFAKEVHSTHAGTKHEEMYLHAIEMAKAQIQLDNKED